MKQLTHRQREVLFAMVELIETEGYWPTVRDLCEYLGMSSTSTAQSHLLALERKGILERRGRRWRIIGATVSVELPALVSA